MTGRSYIVAPATKYPQVLFFIGDVNQAVFFINAATETFYVLERLRFAYSFGKAISLNVLYQVVDFFESLSVLDMPAKIFIKGIGGKDKLIHFP